MKVAVLLSGQMRNAAACVECTHRHVLDRLGDYDLFAHIGDDADARHIDHYRPRTVVLADPPDFDPTPYVGRGGDPAVSPEDIKKLLVQFWRVEQCNRLKKQAEAINGRPYDWVVRLRTDSLYFNDIEDLATLDPRAIYVPTFGNYWGYNDRFAFGGSAVMDVYHDKLGAPLEACLDAGAKLHPEILLRAVIDRARVPVKRTAIIFDTLRKNGTRLTLTWAPQFGDVMPDFMPEWRRKTA